MKILAIANVDPQMTLEKIQPHLEAEVKHAWKLYKKVRFEKCSIRSADRVVIGGDCVRRQLPHEA